MFISSAVVNILIYLPLGVLAKYHVIVVDYAAFLALTIVVFALDFAISLVFLTLKGFKPILLMHASAGGRQN